MIGLYCLHLATIRSPDAEQDPSCCHKACAQCWMDVAATEDWLCKCSVPIQTALSMQEKLRSFVLVSFVVVLV